MTHDTRGHYGIAMLHPAHPENVGAVARATGCFDADYMVTIGYEYEHHPASVGHERHCPIWHFPSFKDMLVSLPYETEIITVDYNESGTELDRFTHPERALYILGQEGAGFEQYPSVTERADRTVYIQSEYCMNVAVAGNMVLQDRYHSSG